MGNSFHDGTTVVVLTLEQRDVLRRELVLELDAVLDDLRIPARDGHALDQLVDLRERADIGMAVLDGIGWGLYGTRDTYHVTAHRGSLTAWLQSRRDQTVECLRDSSEGLADPWRAWGRYGTGTELSESVTAEREACDRDLEVLAVLDDLLEQIEAYK